MPRRRLSHAEAAEMMLTAGMEPLEPYPGVHAPWRCRCLTCGREVTPRFNNVRRGSRCIYCTGRAVVPDDAIAEMRAAGLEPLIDYPGANTPWPCLCQRCGNEVSPRLSSIRQGQGTCVHCAGKARIGTTDAEAQVRAIGLEPLEPYPLSIMKPWRCRCVTCGNEGAPMLHSIRRGQGGCRYCGKNVPIPPADAEAEMRSLGYEPLVAYPGAASPWLCRCRKCGGEASPTLTNARRGQQGCKECAPNAPVGQERAVTLMRLHGFEPLEAFPGSAAPWLCRCTTCGNDSKPTYTNVRMRSGCKFCADHGVDWAAPTFVYLLHHPELGAHKVGIANENSNRVKDFVSAGWQPFRTLSMSTGDEAYRIEQTVLAPYREMALCPYLSRAELPSGWTETIDAEAVTLPELWNEIVQAATCPDSELI